MMLRMSNACLDDAEGVERDADNVGVAMLRVSAARLSDADGEEGNGRCDAEGVGCAHLC